MSGQPSHVGERAADLPAVKFLVVGLLALLLAIAVGHLYVLRGLTDLYFGLPLWIWLELLVIAVLLVVAWITVRLMAGASGGGE